MDEYLKYLNSMKNVHHYEPSEQSNYQPKKYHHHKGDYKKRKPRDFKDLDDIDSTTTQPTNKRKLISYDDL